MSTVYGAELECLDGDNSETVVDTKVKLGRPIVLNEFYFWAPSRLPIPNGGERGRGQRSNHTPKNKSLPDRNHAI
jgi:hypothetical protein